MESKKPVIEIKPETKQKWLRGLFMLVLFVCGWIAVYVAVAIAIFQFIWSLFSDDHNQNLLGFSKSLTQYLTQILQYLTYTSDAKPFPFSSWPNSEVKRHTTRAH